jgi:transposase
MRVEEHLAQLEAENAALREEVRQLQTRVAELEGRLAKESQNSSKPPSSDGWGHKPHSQRKGSVKKSGGQDGHMGHSLPLAEQPGKKVLHVPSTCVPLR